MRLLFAIAGSFFLASTSMEAGVVELRDRVTVTTGSVVCLGDVAKILDPNPQQASMLEAMPLGPAPAPGRTWSVSYDDVRQKLQARGVNLADVEFRGQRQVIVAAAAVKVEPSPKAVVTQPISLSLPPRVPPVRPRSKAEIEADQRRAEALLISVLQRSFKPAETGVAVDFDIQFDSADTMRVLRCRAEDIHFASAALRSDAPTPMIAWWFDESGERQQMAVSVSLVRRPQRLAVRHAVPKGFAIRPEDLVWIDADKDDAGLMLLGDAVGKETTRSLRAGQALADDDVASVPLMRTNDIVTVVVRRPGISVRREFKALSSGAMNETVSLVALNDPRLRIQATVSGYREATLFENAADIPRADAARFEERPATPAPRNWSVR